jgi:chemotaxis response regulator CheB
MDTQRHHPIRIAIADDHPICRDGLRRLLQAESDLTVIGEACDGAEAAPVSRLTGQPRTNDCRAHEVVLNSPSVAKA